MNRIEQILKDYDNRVSCKETSFEYTVTEKILLKEGTTLHLFDGVNSQGTIIQTSAIEYPSGEVMLLDDWQNGRPTDDMEIEDYNWVTSDGRPTIMIDGLPRIL